MWVVQNHLVKNRVKLNGAGLNGHYLVRPFMTVRLDLDPT